MKKTSTHYKRKKVIPYRRPSRYPNAADKRYYWELFCDGVLRLATVCGAITVFLFLFLMA